MRWMRVAWASCKGSKPNLPQAGVNESTKSPMSIVLGGRQDVKERGVSRMRYR